jgi:penicillin-binding protein
MYGLISPQSRQLYPNQVFQARYDLADKDINFAGLNHSIHEVFTQGTTAIVKYDLSIESPFFGTIDDSGRTMRLVQTPEGWRIAWTTMDIFEGLAAGARVTVDSRFPPRANIYDRDGNLLVEEGGIMVALYGIQQNMRGVGECIDLLAWIMRRQRRDLVTWFGNYLDESRFYLGEIDLDTYLAQPTWKHLWRGRAIQRETRAYYGHGALAQVTGFIGQLPAEQLDQWLAQGYREGDLIGLAGLENAYQDTLAGRAERFLRITEPGGTTLRELGNVTGAAPRPSR